MSDTTIITGQFVRINQTPANIGERFLARMIDGVIIGVYVFASYFALLAAYKQHFLGDFFSIFFFIVVYLPVWGYSFLFELFNQGQTPGKRLLNIKVVMLDGSTPAMSGYLLRWLLYPIDVTFTSGLGVLFVLLTNHRQRIGDLAAGTMVIRLNNYKRIKVSLDEYQHLNENYIPAYPQVTDLSFEQIELIRKVLGMKDKKQLQYIYQLANKLKQLMKVEVKTGDYAFLERVVKDYEYYAYVEI